MNIYTFWRFLHIFIEKQSIFYQKSPFLLSPSSYILLRGLSVFSLKTFEKIKCISEAGKYRSNYNANKIKQIYFSLLQIFFIYDILNKKIFWRGI